MNEKHKELLRRNRVNIVSDVEPRGTVLDSLHEDGVFTENDIEHVSSGKTRQERCQLLLSILQTRGPIAYGSFQKALEQAKYEFLAEKLNNQCNELSFTDDKADQDLSGGFNTCSMCCLFLKKVNNEDKFLNKHLCRVINRYCCLLLDNIEPKDVVDQLFQDSIITTDDVDTIFAGATRRCRCEILFEILLSLQDDRVVGSLRLALIKKYSYIVEHTSHDFCTIQQIEQTSNSHRSEDTRMCINNVSTCVNIKNDSCDECLNTFVKPCRKITPKCKKEVVEEEDSSTFIDSSTHMEKDELRTYHGTDVALFKRNPFEFPNDRTKEKFSQNDTSHSLIGNSAFTCTETSNAGHSGDKIIDSSNVEYVQGSGQYKNKDTLHRKSHRKFHGTEMIPKQVTAIQCQTQNRRLTIAFNYLSTLINQGDFQKFKTTSDMLKISFPKNFDLMYITGYLQTCRDLFQTNFDSAKSNLDSTMALVPKTCNPRYFLLELLTAKSRMYITRKMFEKIKLALDEAIMVFRTDPIGCSGRAAGWLYMNDARNHTAQISCLNLRNPNACKVYERLFESAKTSFQMSMENFKKDVGKDGPFGFGYALCRLVILLLRCGENGLTMNSLTPPADDISTAGHYLHHLEDSDILISIILDMHFRLAKCDYQYRLGYITSALCHAQKALDIATELRLFEFTEHAYNRVFFLKSKSPINSASDELSGEEELIALFEESSGNEYDT